MFTRLIALAFVLVAPVGAAAQTETVYYFHTDAIGSVRSITNQSQEEVARHDFLPFGEEWAATSFANISSHVRFAGLERDPETGLDYAMARYYRPQSGRFTNPDIAGIDQGPRDSQSWNLYTYVRNKPLAYVDPTGRFICSIRLSGDDAAAAGVPDGGSIIGECVDAEDPWKRAQRFFLESLLGYLITPTVADFSAGFGDTLSLGVTRMVRSSWEVDPVDPRSRAYTAGAIGGVALGTAINVRGYQTGHEFVFGRNLRIAPWGNRTPNPTGRVPHYHRRGPTAPGGGTQPGQGIGRHRPWDTRSTDTSIWDRF